MTKTMQMIVNHFHALAELAADVMRLQAKGMKLQTRIRPFQKSIDGLDRGVGYFVETSTGFFPGVDQDQSPYYFWNFLNPERFTESRLNRPEKTLESVSIIVMKPELERSLLGLMERELYLICEALHEEEMDDVRKKQVNARAKNLLETYDYGEFGKPLQFGVPTPAANAMKTITKLEMSHDPGDYALGGPAPHFRTGKESLARTSIERDVTGIDPRDVH